MYFDIVFPKDNESEFEEKAIILGYSGICFVYNDKKTFQAKVKKTNSSGKINVFHCLLSEKKLDNLSFLPDIIISEHQKDSDSLLSFENKKINIIFNLENNNKEDFLNQRNSGLNHILSKKAKENNIAVGISFSSFLEKEKFIRARAFGRIKQNIHLCRKYKVRTVFASFAHNPWDMRSPKDLISLARCIFNDERVSKESLSNLPLVLEENIKKKDKNYISEWIKVLE